LAMEEHIALKISQYKMFDEAKRRKDILKIWKIVRECATDQDEQSPYVYVAKLISRMKISLVIRRVSKT
jgi:hypothetical protein